MCGAALHTVKTVSRTLRTFAAGAFQAREILKACSADSSHPRVRSEELARVAPPRLRFGYDLIVYVGLARYREGRQREEIRAALRRERGLELSAGSVSNLCDLFLSLLEALHLARAPQLAEAIRQRGGYPLHLDATNEHGKGGWFVCLDGWSGWALLAGRIPCEAQEHLEPLVRRTIELFGDPIATVRDLGVPGGKAVAPLARRGVPDFVCHYHFLRVVGGRLFDRPYATLRGALRKSKTRPALRDLLKELRRCREKDGGRVRENLLALVYWILEGDGKKDAPYPFGLPHLAFVQRCRDAMLWASLWAPAPRSPRERKALRRLDDTTQRVRKEQGILDVAQRLAEGWEAFGQLRAVLRLSDDELPGGKRDQVRMATPAARHEENQKIARRTREYIERLRARVEGVGKGANAPEKTIVHYLDKYEGRLFGHPVVRNDQGAVIRAVERTNNMAEQFFGAEKRQLRRRVGRAHLGRDLEDQPAQAALAANLRHPEYVRILCGSIENLPNAFAQLGELGMEQGQPLTRGNRDRELQRRTRLLLDALNDKNSVMCNMHNHDQEPERIAPQTTVV